MIVSLLLVIPIQISNASNINLGSTHTVKQQDALCGKNSGSDVKSSLILSIVTLCLPGILEKIYDWNQIKCQEVQCMYDAVKNNLDPSFCSRTKAYQVCTVVVGEMFAIPPMAILEYYRKAIAQLLANPIGMAYSGAVLGARHLVNTGCTKGALCSPSIIAASVFIVTTSDIASLIQRLKDMLENGFFPPGVGDAKNYCKNMGKISKEMQTIVDNS